jgi:hypothetical protein
LFFGTPSRIRIRGTVREIGEGAFFVRDPLIDLDFEEGTVRIGVSAFGRCYCLQQAAFPAPLTVIEATVLQPFSFAVGSQLRYIRSEAFSDSHLNEVVIPPSIREIDPYAFSREVW